jgi:hypothetical protein
MRRSLFLLLFFFIVSLFSVSVVHAQVQTRLRVIQASNIGSNVDPSLRDVYKKLGSLFSFTSYRLLSDQDLALHLNQPSTVQVHQEVFIEITLVGQQKEIAELRVKVYRKGSDILNTQVRLSPGRTVFIGGTRHRGGVVIYALSAQF